MISLTDYARRKNDLVLNRGDFRNGYWVAIVLYGDIMMGERRERTRPLGRPPKEFMPPFPGETGMKLVGLCKNCRWWELPATGCPIVITTEEADEDHITPPDFGCVRWEAKEE